MQGKKAVIYSLEDLNKIMCDIMVSFMNANDQTVFPKHVILQICNANSHKSMIKKECWKLYHSLRFYLNEGNNVKDTIRIKKTPFSNGKSLNRFTTSQQNNSPPQYQSLSEVKLFWAFCNCYYGNQEISVWKKVRTLLLRYVLFMPKTS
jgi:hypothetical protein